MKRCHFRFVARFRESVRCFARQQCQGRCRGKRGIFGSYKSQGSFAYPFQVNPDALGASPAFDQEAAQRAAIEFQNMLRQLSDMQKVMLEQVKAGGGEGCKFLPLHPLSTI